MTATLSRALRVHRMASRYKGSQDYVFASERGTPLDGRNTSRAFTATLKRAGLPAIRFHDLRHSFASLLIAQGAHPKFISEQLGHASSQITLDRYSHLFDQSYADESAKLEAALFSDSPLQAGQPNRRLAELRGTNDGKVGAKAGADGIHVSSTEKEKAPFPGLFVVAGAGFEPATSGL